MSVLLFIYIIYGFTILIHITAGIITAAFVIPLQIRQLKVKNGLFLLRKQLLIRGVLSFVVIVFSILALTSRYFIPNMDWLRYIITVAILMHGLGTLGKAIIDLVIYRQQYTPKQIKLHEKIAKLEKRGSGKNG